MRVLLPAWIHCRSWCDVCVTDVTLCLSMLLGPVDSACVSLEAHVFGRVGYLLSPECRPCEVFEVVLGVIPIGAYTFMANCPDPVSSVLIMCPCGTPSLLECCVVR